MSNAITAAALGWPHKRAIGDFVRKVLGSSWRGRVAGFYLTENNPEGYVVESTFEPGSVQAWPDAALEIWTPKVDPRDAAALRLLKEALQTIADLDPYPSSSRATLSARWISRSALAALAAAKGAE